MVQTLEDMAQLPVLQRDHKYLGPSYSEEVVLDESHSTRSLTHDKIMDLINSPCLFMAPDDDEHYKKKYTQFLLF